MKRTRTSLCLLPCLLITACNVPPGAYYNRGDPENLIDVSTEVVHVNMVLNDDLKALEHILQDDPPTRAELGCAASDDVCAKAGRMLDKADIAASYVTGGDKEGVDLIYDRVVARDCENRYIDNSSNNHNLPPPTFGCSITSNMVQMVTDKQQFTNPNLTDYPDAEKAVQAYEHYRNPPDEPAVSEGSLLSTVSTSQ